MNNKTILEVYGMRPVTNSAVPDKLYTTGIGSLPLVSPDLLVGLELEIENLPEGLNHVFGGLFRVDTDGSLRNNGREAITLPMKAKFVENLLSVFFSKNHITRDNYSDRCSTHVHVNCQDLTIDQVRAIALVYQATERLLFAYIGEERENNIYCIPWYQAGFTTRSMEEMGVLSTFDVKVRNWIKYTALNLQPLRNYGTIEFRHLRGTCDVKEIVTWLNIISSIVEYGKKHSYEAISKLIMDMNTVSNYDQFLRDVFGEYAGILMIPLNYQTMLSIGVVDTKLMLMKPPVKKTATKVATPQEWWETVAPVAMTNLDELFQAEAARTAEIRAAEQQIRDRMERARATPRTNTGTTEGPRITARF